MKNIHCKMVAAGMMGLALCAGTIGCATMSPMAFRRGVSTVDTSNQSVAIFTLRTENVLRPAYRPNVQSVTIEDESTATAQRYRVGVAHSRDENALLFLVSVAIEPGTHTLKHVVGESARALVRGRFGFPVDGTFELPANAVTYVGHVNMVNRRRNEGELRSGSVTPLIDQAASGFSGGTFDITVSDRSDVDIPLFIEAYPYLQEVDIGTAIMER